MIMSAEGPLLFQCIAGCKWQLWWPCNSAETNSTSMCPLWSIANMIHLTWEQLSCETASIREETLRGGNVTFTFHASHDKHGYCSCYKRWRVQVEYTILTRDGSKHSCWIQISPPTPSPRTTLVKARSRIWILRPRFVSDSNSLLTVAQKTL